MPCGIDVHEVCKFGGSAAVCMQGMGNHLHLDKRAYRYDLDLPEYCTCRSRSGRRRGVAPLPYKSGDEGRDWINSVSC